MLEQRMLTALLFLAVFLPTLFYRSIEPFALLTLLLVATATWEWARLQAFGARAAWACGAGMALLLAALWIAGSLSQPGHWRSWWLLASGLWLALAGLIFGRGVQGWTQCARALRLCVGLFFISCAWLALVQARLLGLDFLLSTLMLVWVADSAAYFGGKALGRHKIAPAISPGKSWEGALSGLLGVFVLAAGWLWVDAYIPSSMGGSLYTRLWSNFGPLVSVLLLVGLVAMSVVGDLLESLVKRSAGVKDSSHLLPGHGGVLDRIDALLPVLPLALALTLI